MELFRNINFLSWGMAGFVLIIFIYFRLSIRKERIIQSLFHPAAVARVIPSEIFAVKRKRDLSILAAFFFLILAIAGPQWQREYSDVDEMSGNILIAVDTSLSMSARDIKPSRLENAKIMIRFLVNTLKNYRIALSAFQGKSYIQCPLTNDTDAVEYFIDTLTPNMLPFHGTNLSETIVSSAEYLSRYGGDRLLVIITDGEDHSGGVDNAIALAKETNMRIFTVGVGSEEGDILADDSGQGYKKDRAGHTVLSKLDENTLIKIAHQTQGQYVKYSNPEFVSEEIKKFADNLKMSKTKYSRRSGYKNHYQLPLILAILLILIEFMLMEEKTNFKRFMPTVLFLLVFIPARVEAKSARGLAMDGSDSYKKKDYSMAYEYYKKAAEKGKDDRFFFNAADALYKLEQYEDADKYFEKVKEEKLKSKTFFNLGNSKYMQKDLKGAVENYKKAILLDPGDKNARHNLQIVLTEMKNQKSQKDKKNDDKKDQKEDKKKNCDNQKDKGGSDKRKDEKKEQEKKRAEQILDMMKEKENENRKNMDKKVNYTRNSSDDLTDKDW